MALSQEDIKILDKIKLSARQRLFLEEVWAKLETDNKEAMGTIKSFFIKVTTPVVLLIMLATFADKDLMPFANIGAVGLLVLHIFALAVMGVAAICAFIIRLESKEKPEMKMFLVNRMWISFLPSKPSFSKTLNIIVGWAAVIAVIATGFLTIGAVILVLKVGAILCVKAARIPILDILNQGASKYADARVVS